MAAITAGIGGNKEIASLSPYVKYIRFGKVPHHRIGDSEGSTTVGTELVLQLSGMIIPP